MTLLLIVLLLVLLLSGYHITRDGSDPRYGGGLLGLVLIILLILWLSGNLGPLHIPR